MKFYILAALLAVANNSFSIPASQTINQERPMLGKLGSEPVLRTEFDDDLSDRQLGFLGEDFGSPISLEVKSKVDTELSQIIALPAGPFITHGYSEFTLPNPATWQSYSCIRQQDINYPTFDWGYVSGRVYRPVFGRCTSSAAPPNNRPVIVFFNGAGYARYDYDYLAQHMAGLGFIVVVVASDEPSPPQNCNSAFAICIEDRARKGLAFIHSLQLFWEFSSYADFSNLIVMGHSRGGEAAVEAASIIRWEDPFLGNPGVQAVIALAPTDVGINGLVGRRRLSGEESPNLLLLYGTRDEQIRGYPQSMFVPLPPQTAFALYDRAGTEASLEGLIPQLDNMIEKSMHLIQFGTHENFSDKLYDPPNCQPALTQFQQHLTTKGLVNAYLFWKIWGVDGYKVFFDATYDWLWWGFAASMQQYSSGEWGSRRVIDNFQNDILGTSTIGGALTIHGNLTATISDNESSGRMVHGPEDGLRLKLDVGEKSNSNILQWKIPNSEADMSEFTHLSVRIGLAYDFEGSSRVTFRLRGGGSSWSPLLSSVDYGGLLQVEGLDPNILSVGCGQGAIIGLDQTMVTMRTVRIPLTDFNIDMSNISRVQIRFDHEQTIDRTFYIDNIEFTK